MWSAAISFAWITDKIALNLPMSIPHIRAKWPMLLTVALVPIVEASASTLLTRFRESGEKRPLELSMNESLIEFSDDRQTKSFTNQNQIDPSSKY